jgi:plastocyanin
MRKDTSLPIAFGLALTLLAGACSSEEPPPPPPAGGGRQVDAATTGSLSGRITFTGPPPAAGIVRMGADPACVQGAGPNPQSDAVLIGDDGALQNVFVHVKGGLDPAYSFATLTEPALLDQKGCLYTPRVLGVRVGQPIRVLNSDPTMHNVHALPMVNAEFNKSTPALGTDTTQTFTVPEVMVRFKCDVHGWMAAWVGVVAHPYFAVTDRTGAFEIGNLPPGTYTVEAWHETFGTRSAQVTIGEKQAQTVSFTFTAAAAGQ